MIPQRISARELARTAAAQLAPAFGLPPDAIVEQLFRHTPIDFPVVVDARLPFGVHRIGIAGITWRATVYLRSDCALPDADARGLLILLRHEAEHVRQQRADRLFYVRYVTGWLGRFFAQLFRENPFTHGAVRAAWYRAYRALPAEQAAYDAGDRAAELLARIGVGEAWRASSPK